MSHKRKVLQGSASNLVRVLLSMLVSLVLPPFLVHRMAAPEYSAWVLILQLSAYVSLLDFGLQTAIGKYVAEHDASGDREASHHLVSTSFTILSVAAALACVVLTVMVWGVIPADLLTFLDTSSGGCVGVSGVEVDRLVEALERTRPADLNSPRRPD